MSSDDFFKDMGASPPARKTTLARPPPPKVGGTGTTTTSSTLKKAPPARPTSARPTTTAAGRTATGRTATATRTTSAGRTPAGTRAGRTGTAGRTPSSAGRTPSSGARTTAGRTSSAGRRPAGVRPARPATSTSAAAVAPVGGTGFYGASPTPGTHLSSTTSSTTAPVAVNPYAATTTAPAAAAPSSDAWFSSPQQQTTPAAMNPYATPNPTAATTNNTNTAAYGQQPAAQPANVSQWQQPQQQQQQPNQWQQPPQQNQQWQALASMGGSFLMNSMMNPGAANTNTNAAAASTAQSMEYDLENEPPLLEELGINIDHIRAKTLAVILPFQRFSSPDSLVHMDPGLIVEDADLAGPLLFALALGLQLLLTGKLHFGYIYGFGLFGCLAMTLILNLMTPKEAISVWTVFSILGYALLPVNILAAVKIVVVNLIGLETLGRLLALIAVLWSTVASTRLLEVGCGLRPQRYLIGYPIALLYSAFVLLTIF